MRPRNGWEVSWIRLARPALFNWAAADQPPRLVGQTVARSDSNPKALACSCTGPMRGWSRCVDGRPLSGVTIDFLAWCREKLTQAGKTALHLI